MTNEPLTPELTNALEEMVTGRMENTGETRLEATNHLASYVEGMMKYIIKSKTN